MTSQQFINLEFLRRATDPRLSRLEQEELLESLSFALSDENEFPAWIFEGVLSVDGVLSDQIILWLCDLAESFSFERTEPTTLDLVSKLWSNASGSLAKARLIEMMINAENQNRQTVDVREMRAGRFFVGESNSLLEEGHLLEFFTLTDLIIISDRPALLELIPATIRQQPDSVRVQFRDHLARRLPLMNTNAQQVVLALLQENIL